LALAAASAAACALAASNALVPFDNIFVVPSEYTAITSPVLGSV
jgi:hypothetical protein